MKNFKRKQKLKIILSVIVILTMLAVNLNVYVSDAYTVSTSTKELNVEKISNPNAGEGGDGSERTIFIYRNE